MSSLVLTHLALDYDRTITTANGPIDPYLRMRPVDPLVIPVLEKARERRIKLVLTSNTTGDHDRRWVLEETGVLHLFDQVFESWKIGLGKPNPEFYRRVIAATRAKPEQIMFIGDNLVDDVIAPVQHGTQAALVRHPDLPEERRTMLPPAMAKTASVRVIEHLSDLIPLLGL
ncbi:HAD family hydrolase [Streptosporangium saharense]|uniref:HAD family hydrolase n=1 Tax=Streptosporangium saharense TaxID=1706840 RepID=UPI0036AE3117